mmetsp:Transcript_38513/g.87584  ORF Transcript_38513/g.87584 Transcript_38513/m.87584 type:complete len:344 (-) Transcript_38513:89-1120(-)
MIRPVCNCCFALTWLLVIIGVVMYHIIVGQVLPPLKELPTNLAVGFDDVFRFRYLQQDATIVRDSAADALAKCNVVANMACSNYQPLAVTGYSNTGMERRAIAGAFDHSLATIQRVAEDKYFGTPELQTTAKELVNISGSLARISDSMPCNQSSPLYCGIYKAGAELVSRATTVRAEIDRIEGSGAVDNFEEYSGYFVALHALSYLLVIAMVFYTFFWAQGGVCCSDGASRFSCCTLLAFSIFWFIAFVLMLAVVAGGVVAKRGAAEVRIAQLNGSPTVAELLENIEARFPQFWTTVFENLISGLRKWVGASAVLMAICIFVMVYACCICCVRPYRKNGLVEA